MTTSIIWGNGHVFGTWFSGAYVHILGIQGLPLSPLVLHIGQHADYLNNYVTLGMTESSNGKPSGLPNGQWRDVWWNIWSMSNGQAAVNDMQAYGFNYTPEEGETKAHTYQWIYTLKQLGALATGTGALTANSPSAVAFDKSGVKTYLAYNFGCTAQYVSFSDGMKLAVPAYGFRVKKTGDAVDANPGTITCTGSSSSVASSSVASSVASSVVAISSSKSSSSASSTASGNGYTIVSSTSVQFYANNASWADIHYTINNGGQQNIRMTHNADNTNTYTLTGIPAGAVVKYFYTIGAVSGTVTDTAWAQFTMTGASSAASSSVASSAASTSKSSSSSSVTSSTPTTGNGYQVLNTTSVKFYANAAPWADIHLSLIHI